LSASIPEPVLLTAWAVTALFTSIVLLRHGPAARGSVHVNEQKGPHGLLTLMLALCIGVIAGTLGAGGGVLIVPALVSHGRLPIQRASATSLLAIALQSLAGFLAHLGQVSLDWAVVVPFTLMAVLGSVVGGALAKRVPEQLVRRGFAALVCLVAIVVVARAPAESQTRNRAPQVR
jgi:hypothetical protein